MKHLTFRIWWALSTLWILALCSGTAWIFINTENKIKESNLNYFNLLTQEAEKDIANRLAFYEDALWGGVGLFYASENVERSEWKAYVEALKIDRYPGMNGIGYIEKVSTKNLQKFIEKQQITYPNFNVSSLGKINKDDHYIISYIEPLESNIKAVGLDIGSEINRRTAANRAQALGEAVITDPIVLVQDNEQKPGFLILLPIFNDETLSGWIYAPFVADKLLKDTLHNNSLLEIEIVDQNPSNSVIYNSMIQREERAVFSSNTNLFVENNEWNITWKSTPELEKNLNSNDEAYLILALGIALILSSSLFLSFLLRRHYRAQKTVAQATHSLEESEARFTQAFENAAIGIALVGLDGHWMQVNKSLCKMLGYSERKLLSTNFQTITHPDDLNADLQHVEDLLKGKLNSYTMKKRYITKKEECIWVRLNVSLVRDHKGESQYFVSQIENITREKILDDIKSDFISISSHQFRTPLSAIRWNLESILDEDLGKLKNNRIIDALKNALKSTIRMNYLVRDLLRVAKIEGHSIEAKLTEVQVLESIKDVLQHFVEKAKEAQRKIHSPKIKTAPVIADTTLLRETLEILVDNAMIYADEKTDINISVQEQSKVVKVLIENKAAHLNPKDLNKLFEKLARLPQGITQNPNGTGLGLYTAKKLLNVMNGDLEASLADGTICFTATLPKK